MELIVEAIIGFFLLAFVYMALKTVFNLPNFISIFVALVVLAIYTYIKYRMQKKEGG